MDSSGYRSDGVGLAVAIVNAVYGADPDVDDGEAVEDSLRQFGVVTRPLSARGVARFGRNAIDVLSVIPAQRSQSSKYGAWKSEPNAGPRPTP